MFCFQCQETAKNTGCTVKGVCGKPEETANLQDLLIFVMKGISVYGEKLKELGAADRTHDEFIAQGLFATITNANWDDARFIGLIQEGLRRRAIIKAKFLSAYKEKNGRPYDGPLPEAATWEADPAAFADKGQDRGCAGRRQRGCPLAAPAFDHRAKGDCRLRRSCRRPGFPQSGDQRLHDGSPVLHHQGPVDGRDGGAGDESRGDGRCHHGAARRGQHHHLRPTGDHPGQHRRAQEPGDFDQRPRPQGHGGTAQADRGHRGRCVHPRRDAAGQLLSRIQKIPPLRRQLWRLLVAPEQGVRVLQRTDLADDQLHRAFEKGEHLPRPAVHHRSGGLPGRHTHRRSACRRHQGFLRPHRQSQDVSTPDRDRNRHDRRRVRAPPGAGPGRQGRGGC